MSDITERLQERADHFPVIEDNPHSVFVDAKDEITILRHQLEQAQARVALLESAVPWTIYGDNLTATILRKQAEAVESARCRAKIKLIGRNPTAKKVFDLLNQEAGCLRQQADEIEKAGGEQ